MDDVYKELMKIAVSSQCSETHLSYIVCLRFMNFEVAKPVIVSISVSLKSPTVVIP